MRSKKGLLWVLVPIKRRAGDLRMGQHPEERRFEQGSACGPGMTEQHAEEV